MLRRILIVITFLLTAKAAGAAEPKWESHGPYGGLSFGITVDETAPDRVLVKTSRGHVLTTDGGKSWRHVNRPDFRNRWRPIALVRGTLWCEDGGVVHRSVDGKKWDVDGVVSGAVMAFAADGDTLWAIALHVGRDRSATLRMVRREDLGWAVVATFPIPIKPPFRPVARLAVIPGKPAVMRAFVTQFDESNTTLAIGSDDGGRTFTTWGFAPRLWDVVPVPADGPGLVGVSLHHRSGPDGPYVSVDGGRTWKRATEDPRARSLRSIAADGGGRVLLGTTESGILVTNPAFEKIAARGKGLVNENVSSLAFDPGNPSRIWAGTQCGMFRSDDGAKTFAWASRGFEGCQFTGLALGAEGRVLAFEYHQGLRVSEDGGRNWKPVDLAWKKRFGRPYSMVAGGRTIAVSTGDGNDWRITISRDGGKTWSMMRFPGGVKPTGIHPDGAVYASKQGGLLLRAVRGLDFVAFGPKHPKVGPDIHRVLPTADGKKLFLLGELGAVIVSATSGAGDEAVIPPVNQSLLWPLAVLDSGDALYLADRKGRIFRRDPAVGAWESVLSNPGGLLGGVVSDPGRKDRRIALFLDGRVAVSEDRGRTWSTIQKPGGLFTMSDPVVGPDRRLYVTASGAVRTLDLSTLD